MQDYNQTTSSRVEMRQKEEHFFILILSQGMLSESFVFQDIHHGLSTYFLDRLSKQPLVPRRWGTFTLLPDATTLLLGLEVSRVVRLARCSCRCVWYDMYYVGMVQYLQFHISYKYRHGMRCNCERRGRGCFCLRAHCLSARLGDQ